MAICLVVSHPSWVRGLKHLKRNLQDNQQKSHPSWVRGLKHQSKHHQHDMDKSHPSWVRGLKLLLLSVLLLICSRTPRGCVD